MYNSIIIKTESVDDRATLLGVLYSLGAIFHRSSESLTLEQSLTKYTEYLSLRLVKTGSGLSISGVHQDPDVNWSGNPIATLERLKRFTAKDESIRINKVGDYHAKVTKDGIHINGEVISFEKFDEIAAAVTKVKN